MKIPEESISKLIITFAALIIAFIALIDTLISEKGLSFVIASSIGFTIFLFLFLFVAYKAFKG